MLVLSTEFCKHQGATFSHAFFHLAIQYALRGFFVNTFNLIYYLKYGITRVCHLESKKTSKKRSFFVLND